MVLLGEEMQPIVHEDIREVGASMARYIGVLAETQDDRETTIEELNRCAAEVPYEALFAEDTRLTDEIVNTAVDHSQFDEALRAKIVRLEKAARTFARKMPLRHKAAEAFAEQKKESIRQEFAERKAELDAPRLKLETERDELAATIDAVSAAWPVPPYHTEILEAIAGPPLEGAEAQVMLRQQARERLAGLTPREQEALPFLHLYGADVDANESCDFSRSLLSRHVSSAARKMGVGGREELALLALEAGVRYDVKTPDGIGHLSIQQRKVSTRLDKSNSEIAAELELTEYQVIGIMTSLYKATSARSRTEIFIMAHIYGFEPTAEELAIHNHEALQEFTEFRRPVLALVHLKNDKIAEELSRSEESVKDAVSRAVKQAGFSGRTARTALALELYERGFRFDVRKPLRPLAEVLNAKDREIGHILSLSNTDIARTVMNDESHEAAVAVGSLIYDMQGKTGARTRAELALQIRMYDTGESRPKPFNRLSGEEWFFETLGIDPIPMEEARLLLKYATPKQAEYLEALVFSEEQIFMASMGGVARRGLDNIRKGLEQEGFYAPA
jgi:DNA-binding CsgD family transcriptional regulator